MSEEKTIKKLSIFKIIIPVLILVVVIGIWSVKNLNGKNTDNTTDNADFNLAATEKLDLEKLKAYNIPILIEFGSEACRPCQEMKPIIEALNKELKGKAIIKYVDVWANPEFGEDYPLTLIPTQLFINSDGTPYNPENPEALNMNLYSMKDSGEHVYTTHEGTISKETLLDILTEMGMKE
ncbi:MAG: Thioredoxin domain protein [Clostridia bacterium]|nr:Thioredoxin domain protein [Clostridia bacterium]